jgi:mono/diheme cytochrome c family protein
MKPLALVLAATFATLQVAHAASDPDLIKRGEYVAITGDCTACHTTPGGKPFAGGLSLQTPLGAVMSPNITPSKTHGIGNYTLAQFSPRCARGFASDGAHLYPAMPYPAYTKMTDEDIAALYAYFTSAVAPVDEGVTRTALPFPFNIRASMAVWDLLFLHNERFHSRHRVTRRSGSNERRSVVRCILRDLPSGSGPGRPRHSAIVSDDCSGHDAHEQSGGGHSSGRPPAG